MQNTSTNLGRQKESYFRNYISSRLKSSIYYNTDSSRVKINFHFCSNYSSSSPTEYFPHSLLPCELCPWTTFSCRTQRTHSSCCWTTCPEDAVRSNVKSLTNTQKNYDHCHLLSRGIHVSLKSEIINLMKENVLVFLFIIITYLLDFGTDWGEREKGKPVFAQP